MLFNSATFLFIFLPTTLGAFYVATLISRTLAKVVLIVASIIFYTVWNPANLPILLGSTLANYLLSLAIIKEAEKGGAGRRRRSLLILGLSGNLLLLGYFKYTGFLVAVGNDVFSLSNTVPRIVLPLGISFFTFQKIAYLIDVYDGQVGRVSFLDYCLFVFFFPQLISGPIVHHREIIPQLEKNTFELESESFSAGLTLLVLGLAKKVLIADTLATIGNPGFVAISQGNATGAAAAWITMLSTTLQIYFDFSGYSDMAVGLALMFGIRLPLNFNSPFKAANLLELWARWHMSLTRLLTAYVYNPIVLSVSRRWATSGRALPKKRKTTIGAYLVIIALPTMITMLIAGVWHGAGFQFAIFGFLNGLFMALVHGWHQIKNRLGWDGGRAYARPLGVLATMIFFTITLVFFKASSAHAGLVVLSSMFGQGGAFGDFSYWDLGLISSLLMAVWFFPNSQEIVGLIAADPAKPGYSVGALSSIRQRLLWTPSARWGAVIGALGFASLLAIAAGRESPFLYFQF